MQIRKESIRKRIIIMARQEFCSKGLKRTSMKDIASASGIAVGNIYNYFKSKNDIFVEICSPLMKALDDLVMQENGSRNQTIDMFYVVNYQDAMITRFLRIIKEYRHELRLLLFEASGTPLEDYFRHYAAKQAAVGQMYISAMKEKYPHINGNISPYLIELNCNMWFSLMHIVIQNENMNSEELQRFVTDYITFSTAGWKKLFGI